MAAFTFTQTDNVIGTLTNGLKIVITDVTVADAGTGAGSNVKIKPLQRVIKFLPAGTKTTGTGGIIAWTSHATELATVSGNAAGDDTNGVVSILSFGF